METRKMSIKLNIGAGDTVIEGFTPIDRKLGSEAYPLEGYVDNSVDEIRASHILEHFSRDSVPKVLAEWVRVLKPGGRIRIAVPDLEWIASHLGDANAPAYLMGGQSDVDDYHHDVFTDEKLRRLMFQAGLRNRDPSASLDTWKSGNGDCASNECSLNIEGYKPAQVVSIEVSPSATSVMPAEGDKKTLPLHKEDIKITAVMSLPRLGWNDNWGCVIDALRPFGIPLRRFTGAFWGQCLQNMLEDVVKEKLDWVLCIDYDTMFTAKHIDSLFGHLGQNPQIDAVAALQAHRGKEYPLMTIKGLAGCEVGAKPLKVDTAHFGLTLLRVESLSQVQKPWFVGKPGPTGRWDDQRHDPDIWFWKQWKDAGKTVYVAPDCRVGHLQLMVREYNKDMEFQNTEVGAWRDRETTPDGGAR